MSANLAALLYLIAGALFIMALRGLSSPETSRRGNTLGMIGMAIAILTTLAAHPPASFAAWALVVLGMALGGGLGAVIARRVPMTAMPELVAAFHSLVGLAAVFVAAILLELVRSFSSQYFPNTWQGALGVFLLLIILFLPGGIGSLPLRLRPSRAKSARASMEKSK